MRITVNLSQYFHDHRSLAKIFVNKRMKCIKDIEEHIASIFKIQDFYLKCENQYLPPTEDVQILQCDDIVWAVPRTVQESAQDLQINDNLISVSKKKKKAKKKKQLDNDNKKKTEKHEDAMEVVLQTNDELSAPKKKKTKKKKHCDNDDDEKSEKNEDAMEVADFEQTEKKKRPKMNGDVVEIPEKSLEYVTKRRKPASPFLDPNVIKKSGRDSLDSSKSAESINTSVSVKSLVYNFEAKKKSVQSPLPISPEKRINIVKTIIISNKTDDPKSNCFESPERQDSDLFPKSNCFETPERQDSDLFNQTEDSSSLLDTSSFTCSGLTETDFKVNKRKRKRTRKRKTKQDFPTTFEQPVYNLVPKSPVIQTPTHIIFNDTPGNVTMEIMENNVRDSTSDVIMVETENTMNVEKSENIEHLQLNGTTIINLENSTYDDKEIEDCILKHPITENLEPKVDDVIAFKILRISESYTPEISSTIVGKVTSYKSDNKEIAFDVIYGSQQCTLPQGKFFLEENEQPAEACSKFKCSWTTLLEPRLIYP